MSGRVLAQIPPTLPIRHRVNVFSQLLEFTLAVAHPVQVRIIAPGTVVCANALHGVEIFSAKVSDGRASAYFEHKLVDHGCLPLCMTARRVVGSSPPGLTIGPFGSSVG